MTGPRWRTNDGRRPQVQRNYHLDKYSARIIILEVLPRGSVACPGMIRWLPMCCLASHRSNPRSCRAASRFCRLLSSKVSWAHHLHHCRCKTGTNRSHWTHKDAAISASMRRNAHQLDHQCHRTSSIRTLQPRRHLRRRHRIGSTGILAQSRCRLRLANGVRCLNPSVVTRTRTATHTRAVPHSRHRSASERN